MHEKRVRKQLVIGGGVSIIVDRDESNLISETGDSCILRLHHNLITLQEQHDITGSRKYPTVGEHLCNMTHKHSAGLHRNIIRCRYGSVGRLVHMQSGNCISSKTPAFRSYCNVFLMEATNIILCKLSVRSQKYSLILSKPSRHRLVVILIDSKDFCFSISNLKEMARNYRYVHLLCNPPPHKTRRPTTEEL